MSPQEELSALAEKLPTPLAQEILNFAYFLRDRSGQFPDSDPGRDSGYNWNAEDYES